MKTKEEIQAYYNRQKDLGNSPKCEVVEMLEGIGMNSMAAAVHACQIELQYTYNKKTKGVK